MEIIESLGETKSLNEMMVKDNPSLSPEVENSIYYPKLKALLHKEIFNFCKYKPDLKMDLNVLRMMVGSEMFENDIRTYLDGLKEKYNGKVDDVGLDYHIEATRIDFGVAVFVVLKLTDIQLKKFVFRFRKAKGIQTGIEPLNLGGLIDGV